MHVHDSGASAQAKAKEIYTLITQLGDEKPPKNNKKERDML